MLDIKTFLSILGDRLVVVPPPREDATCHHPD